MDTIGFVFGVSGLSFGLIGFVFAMSAVNNASSAGSRIDALERRLSEAGVISPDVPSDHS